ncbi:MAG: hypothetical protein IKH07_09630, partial [Oscillospiraceae bacterium]|nr:hypothetical protein [Oscillospiraceae bacterium]
MDVLDFSGLPIPPEARAAMARIRDPGRWLLENKARSFNQQLAPPDGSGVDCARCGNKGSVAVVDEDGPRLVVRPCVCQSRRDTALRLKACGMLDRARVLSFE